MAASYLSSLLEQLHLPAAIHRSLNIMHELSFAKIASALAQTKLQKLVIFTKDGKKFTLLKKKLEKTHIMSKKRDNIKDLNLRENRKAIKEKLKDIQESITALSEYENYMLEHRKPNLKDNISSLEFFEAEKRKHAEFLKNITDNKLEKIKEANLLSLTLENLEVQIKNEKNTNNESAMKSPNGGNNTKVAEAKNQVYRSQISLNKQKSIITENPIKFPSLNLHMKESSVTGPKNSLTLAVHTLVLPNERSADLYSPKPETNKLSLKLNETSKLSNNTEFKINKMNSSPKLDILSSNNCLNTDLTRKNKERLKLIEKKSDFHELLQNLIGPSLERVKKAQSNNKFEVSPKNIVHSKMFNYEGPSQLHAPTMSPKQN